MATKVEDALVELEAALAVVMPMLEGLNDYNRLNIHDDSRVVVGDALNYYQTRVTLLQQAIAALEALLQHGYPELQKFEVSESILLDLQEQQTTITAALGQFGAKAPATLKVTVGTPVPKR
jgi:hypothetical protein